MTFYFMVAKLLKNSHIRKFILINLENILEMHKKNTISSRKWGEKNDIIKN